MLPEAKPKQYVSVASLTPSITNTVPAFGETLRRRATMTIFHKFRVLVVSVSEECGHACEKVR